MPKNFAFNLLDEGTPNQRIVFRFEGEEPQNIPVPDQSFPAEMEPRFRAIYQVLVDRGVIENLNPVFRAAS